MPPKEIIDQATKTLGDLEKQGIKIRVYCTLGRCNSISIVEAPTEKDALNLSLGFQG